MNAPIRVMIIDDAALVRQVMAALLARDPQIVVIGAAPDPVAAQELMAAEWPDVIVMDLELPRMDGITFLKKLMAERPTPVVICSALTEKGAPATMQALMAGAVCCLSRPQLGIKEFLTESAAELIRNVRLAAQSRPKPGAGPALAPASPSPSPSPSPPPPIGSGSGKVVAIGASTGGTQALEVVLTALPRAAPGILIVQHMPAKYTRMFAERLNGICAIEVREARNGDRIVAGCALIAPGGQHMRLNRGGGHYQVEVADGPPVNRHRPSVDVLFKSAAQSAGANALGVIMTGMGDDGARGLLAMHQAGARTVAQDEASCVVFGMPREALKLGAADAALPLEQIAADIIRFGRQ